MRTTNDWSGRVGNRRAFLKVGSAGLLGLTLPGLLRLEAQRENRPARGRRARAVILVFLDGGPSTIDMWDLKPDAPAEIRGEFRPVATAVPGVQICEHLSRLAQVLNRVTLVRSLHHVINDHAAGSRYVLAGRLPGAAANPPALASLAASLLTPAAGTPPSATLLSGYEFGLTQEDPGRLGAAYRPLRVNLAQPGGPRLEGLSLPDTLPVAELEDRERLRRRLDRSFAMLDRVGLPAELDRFQQQALDILRSDRVRRALDVRAERAEVRAEYGVSEFGRVGNVSDYGRAFVAARRLIEAGVRFVTIGADANGWDTHSRQFPALRDTLLPPLDRALAALLTDLDRRGLLAETMVYCVGEFGRTPRVNGNAGRDHWPGSMAALLAGGGFRRGHVHGSTDRYGMAPNRAPCTPADVAATIFHRLGFAPTHRLATLRDTTIFPEGRVLTDLFDG